MSLSKTEPNNSLIISKQSPTEFSRYALPQYLVKAYWWAYLSPLGVKVFDHPFMVNRILWGQYQKISQAVIAELCQQPEQVVAGITSAYGNFYPDLLSQNKIKQLHLFDIAPIQLNAMQQKLSPAQLAKCSMHVADAAQIAIHNQMVDSAVLYFLLHELPAHIRTLVLNEVIRIVNVGGKLVVADYMPLSNHLFHRQPWRTIFERMEPYLANFWRSDLLAELEQAAERQGRVISHVQQKSYWHNFYRVLTLTIE